ncbi:HDIG domain-containing protein [Actinoallomurus purpureus]|uniref:HD domain-containing protein n=1 Tax=Actinoallomurus purpureus TaxID=478114 RepID=UPI002092E8BF|nr:HD domain-containing protein [Actinoallomurus purpureus]MCO6007347.1 HDIG domain-containing protein [Actinoallomurus purpureus]
MLLPTDEEIRALHEKHAPTRAAFDLVHTHCEIVCGIAEQLLADGDPSLDADLVRAGSLLHDIGVYRLYDTDGRIDESGYIRHGILGDELLRDEGIPDVLRRFCSRHTGVGITRDDVRRQELPLPVADYVAESREEELVMYADKFHSKTDPPTFVSATSYADRIRRFGADKVAKFTAMCETFGVPDLRPFVAEYGHVPA